MDVRSFHQPPAPPVPAGLVALGWDAGWADVFRARDATGMRPARVVAAHRDAWVVADGSGEHEAVVAGRLRHEALGPTDLPAVGDWVVGVAASPAPGPWVIHAVLERRSAFRRTAGDSNRRSGQRLVDEQVLAANVDVALVVTGLDGDFNVRRIERYLAAAHAGGSRPVVVLNKLDLARDPDGAREAARMVAPDVDVEAVSALEGTGVPDLEAHQLRPGTTAVVLGSSGVGKSTLVNALLGHDRQRTAAVREDDARGRHTTTARELLRLPGGALLIDSPGIRSLEVAGAADGLGAAFADLADLAAACRFRDCRHEAEPGCAVRAGIASGRLDPARLESHRKLLREATHAARAGDPLARAAERRRWRIIHRSVRRQQREIHGER